MVLFSADKTNQSQCQSLWLGAAEENALVGLTAVLHQAQAVTE